MDRTRKASPRPLTASRIGPKGPMFGTARARRRVAPLLVLAALVGVPAFLAIAVDRGSAPAAAVESGSDRVAMLGAEESARPVAPEPAAGHVGAGDDPASLLPSVFATYEGLALKLPSGSAVLVGFHEASQMAALPLLPVGTIQGNANTTRFRPPPDAAEGAPYLVMSSRGRSPAPTSAVDVVLRDDDPVLAPVSGVVTDVRPYHLYGKYPDHRIEIAPAGRPDLRVVMIHVSGVAVAVGDEVEAGVSAIAASANRFSFGSHIDRYTEPDRWPHVHLEVKSADAERPGEDG